jgi:hypothetical protein
MHKMLWLFGCVVLALGGCGTQDLREAISGRVTFDGQPLAHGSLRFEPLDTRLGQAAGAVITQGQFQVDSSQGLTPGAYRVAVSSPRVEPTAAPSMDNSGPVEERIPARYNANSELKINVESGGTNQFQFDLLTTNSN